MPESPATFDVLIIGGGPGGATAGLLLARAGWSVAIVEQASYPRRKVCGEFLSASNLPLLRLLHLDNAFCRLAGPEVRRLAVFAGDAAVIAAMPALGADADGWGRALGREHLDLPMPLGPRVPTVVVEPQLLEGTGLFVKEGRLKLWLTDDARRIPVRMRSKVPVGSVSADLESYTPPDP